MKLKSVKLYGEDDFHTACPMKIKQGDIVTKFKLPPMEYFKAKNKKEKQCAWVKLGMFVLKRLGGIEKNPDLTISNVTVSMEDSDILSRLSYNWMTKSCSYIGLLSERKRHAMFGDMSLNFSPNSSDSKIIKSGYVYVTK